MPRVEDATDVAALVDNVPIVRAPRPRYALARVAKDQRPADQLLGPRRLFTKIGGCVAEGPKWTNGVGAARPAAGSCPVTALCTWH